MTCLRYLRPIRTDPTNSSYTIRIFEWSACETVLQLRALPLLLFFASIYDMSHFFHSVGVCVWKGGGEGGNEGRGAIYVKDYRS